MRLRWPVRSAERIHINRVIENPAMLNEYQILVVPGGFSYGDDVAAGKILANQLKHHLYEPSAIHRCRQTGAWYLQRLSGTCKGRHFAGRKAEGLPKPSQPVTITYNDSGKFEDRWVYLEPVSRPMRLHRTGQTDRPADRARRGQGCLQG